MSEAGQGALSCSKDTQGSFADRWDSFCQFFRKEKVQSMNSSRLWLVLVPWPSLSRLS